MIEYRSFRNFDPPGIWKLWCEGLMGRGASKPKSIDALEDANYGQPYFDPQGLILAHDGSRIVGMAHAGFGATEDRTQLDRSLGVICAVLVHPDYRRRGIGTELTQRAENYLRHHSVLRLLAGPARGLDPFYFGIYGGCRPCGFLESDVLAQPFLIRRGYRESARHAVFDRDLRIPRDPTSMRSINIRRLTEVEILEGSEAPNWWWFTHLGKTDAVRYRLKMKRTGETIATINAVPLDHYAEVWPEKTVGIVDMRVADAYQRQGYGQNLLIEVVKLLRKDRFDRAEITAPESSPSAIRLLTSAGFTRIDTGVVYEKD